MSDEKPKTPKRVRRWLHKQGIHELCRITFEPVIDHYDFGKHYLVGRLNDDGTRDIIDATTFGGTPVYKAGVPPREVHS